MIFLNIVIPVCSLHRSLIKQCLDSIQKQTRFPDKIILVLNEYEKYKNEYDDIISKNMYCMFVKLNTWEKPGINRNIGSCECVDGIILYQDVDDIMHPQRCEFVEKCFDLLLHESVQDYKYFNNEENFVFEYSETNVITAENIVCALTKVKDFRDGKVINFSHYFGNIDNKNKHSNLHNGQCCVKTRVLTENKNIWADYYEAEDIKFVNDITRKYKNTLIFMVPLVIVVGRDHIRLIDEKVCHKKSHKQLNYDPILNKSI